MAELPRLGMNHISARVISTNRCADAFGAMFWAFLFFLDFGIGFNGVTLDILPDIVGWLLMLSALKAIPDLSPDVRPLRTLALWLAVLSLFSLIQIKGASGTGVTGLTIVYTLHYLFTAILELIYIWMLCGLIMGMGLAYRCAALAERADFRRKFYAILQLSFLVLPGILMIINDRALVIATAIVGFLIYAILFCLMMGLMKATQKMCIGCVEINALANAHIYQRNL
ncbi:MAG: hypothetical protein WC655_07730 [Candidatus Hydrogenedentales bacterium]